MDDARHRRPPRADLARDGVREVQRAWLLAAVVKVSAETGAGGLTVAAIADRAGVSTRTFGELFDSCEQCLLAAMMEALAKFSAVVIPAYRSGTSWPERVRAGLGALLECFDQDPEAARVCVVDSLAAGPKIVKQRMHVLGPVISAVDEGRAHARSGLELPPMTAEGIVGAALHLVHRRLVERSDEPFGGLVNQLMAMIVLPYLGAEAAEHELRTQTPTLRVAANGSPERGHAQVAEGGETLGGLKMRLTYRTLRVLRAIESSPGSSNREVGARAEIVDPGQVSKLLARLRNLELIHNAATSKAGGSPNIWRLTDRGERFLGSIRALADTPESEL